MRVGYTCLEKGGTVTPFRISTCSTLSKIKNDKKKLMLIKEIHKFIKIQMKFKMKPRQPPTLSCVCTTLT